MPTTTRAVDGAWRRPYLPPNASKTRTSLPRIPDGRTRKDRTPTIRRHFYQPAYTLFIFLVGGASYEEPYHKYYGPKSQFEDQPIGWICHVKSPTSQRSLAEVKK